MFPWRGHFTTKYIYNKFPQKKCSSNKTIIFLPKKSPIICIHLHKGKSPFRVSRFYIRILQIMSSVPQEYSFQLMLLLGLHRYFSQKEIFTKNMLEWFHTILCLKSLVFIWYIWYFESSQTQGQCRYVCV